MTKITFLESLASAIAEIAGIAANVFLLLRKITRALRA
jgi:hypothetical protein